jgi:transcriptional regulator with XRE-family HTH domain
MLRRPPKPKAPSATPAPRAADAICQRLGDRVRQLRADRGWSLQVLATASGVSRSMLSQIERDQANPTLAVTLRIAQAFGMTLGDLVQVPDATSAITVIRANDRAYHYRSDKHCRIRTLSPLNLEKDVEFYEVQLQPGGALRSAPHYQGTREFLTVETGQVRVESDGDTELIGKGDSVSYRADVPHAIINAGPKEAVLFLVDIYKTPAGLPHR